MTTEFLTTVAQSGTNQWSYILPEILLAGLALLLLVFEVVFPQNLKRHIPTISIIAQLGILAMTICAVLKLPHFDPTSYFYGMLINTPMAQFMRIFFIVVSILVHALAMISLKKQRVPRTEFFHIVLIITAAMMLLAQSAHFLMLFVALETVTVGFYILVSYYRTSPLSLEAGLKYLVLGALSSGLLLFGIVLLYGVAGKSDIMVLPHKTGDALSFIRVFSALYSGINPSGINQFLGNLGALLVLSGAAFKIGLVPFQIWIPDVYQGAPTPVTAFLSIGSKTAGFAVLFAIFPFISPCKVVVVPFLTVLTFATIIFGNLAALTQHNVKRLMGLSGVSHAGFIMMAFMSAMGAFDYMGHTFTPIFVYLIAYALASFAVFGVMTLIAGENDAEQELSDYHGLAKRSPFLAGVLAVGLGSLAGIPPLFGFMAKLLVFINVFRAGLYALLIVAILAVVVSIYYYFAWIRAAFFTHWESTPVPDEPTAPPTQPANVNANAIHVPLAMKLLLAALALASILFGLWQTPVMNFLSSLGLS